MALQEKLAGAIEPIVAAGAMAGATPRRVSRLGATPFSASPR
jgi:hypothetical protein